MITTTLCMIRHGETAWNAQQRIQGQLDIPLSALGVAQARAAAASLAAEPFDAIYSSDLVRAGHTAESIAHVLHQPISWRHELRERHYGVFQGLTYAEARRQHPEEFASFESREPEFVIPGGESLGQFSARVGACLDEIVECHRGGQVLIATHGGVLDIAYRRASGRSLTAPRDFEIPNAALNWIEVIEGRWYISAWAERAHLEATLDDLPG